MSCWRSRLNQGRKRIANDAKPRRGRCARSDETPPINFPIGVRPALRMTPDSVCILAMTSRCHDERRRKHQ